MKIKKLVAMLATAAMAVGLMAVAPTEAKAADEISLVGYINGADVNAGTYVFEGGSVDVAFSADSYVCIAVGSDWYMTASYVGSGTEATVAKGNKEKMFVPKGSWTFSVVANGDGSYKISYKEKVVANPAEVIAKIDAIGTVAYTKECLAKIEAAEGAYTSFSGNKADVTNYATLTAARAKYNELKAAAMGEVTVYVKNADWTNVKAYTYPDNLGYGSWPGKAISEDTDNKGWYVCKATISEETKFEFSDGTTQSAGLMIDAKGTYWLTLSTKGSDGKYTVDNVTTTAPTGWVGSGNGGSGSTPTPTPTPTPEAPDTADVAPVVAMVAVAALAAVVVLKKRTVNE